MLVGVALELPHGAVQMHSHFPPLRALFLPLPVQPRPSHVTAPLQRRCTRLFPKIMKPHPDAAKQAHHVSSDWPPIQDDEPHPSTRQAHHVRPTWLVMHRLKIPALCRVGVARRRNRQHGVWQGKIAKTFWKACGAVVDCGRRMDNAPLH
ncbi:hypothetical protein T484DRAFT_3096321 [Baffinella frigidus]|nr:hypothetical protein T484DRAFT_3096321 [Cryptophyta sp. CCMP2293]